MFLLFHFVFLLWSVFEKGSEEERRTKQTIKRTTKNQKGKGANEKESPKPLFVFLYSSSSFPKSFMLLSPFCSCFLLHLLVFFILFLLFFFFFFVVFVSSFLISCESPPPTKKRKQQKAKKRNPDKKQKLRGWKIRCPQALQFSRSINPLKIRRTAGENNTKTGKKSPLLFEGA